MKLKRKSIRLKNVPKERKSPEGNAKWNTLSDEYRPMFEPKDIPIRKFESRNGDLVEQYLQCKVQRFNDDEGLPFVFIQMFQTHHGNGYSGPLKGKTVYFPLSELAEVQDALTGLADTCDRLKIDCERYE